MSTAVPRVSRSGELAEVVFAARAHPCLPRIADMGVVLPDDELRALPVASEVGQETVERVRHGKVVAEPTRAASTSAASNVRFLGGFSDVYEVYAAVNLLSMMRRERKRCGPLVGRHLRRVARDTQAGPRQHAAARLARLPVATSTEAGYLPETEVV